MEKIKEHLRDPGLVKYFVDMTSSTWCIRAYWQIRLHENKKKKTLLSKSTVNIESTNKPQSGKNKFAND